MSPGIQGWEATRRGVTITKSI